MEETIKLVRFMSDLEFVRLIRGTKLTNRTQWKAAGSHTDVVGFCFFPLNEPPEQMIHILSGIATLERVVIVETNIKNVRQATGRYRDPEKDDKKLMSTPLPELLRNPLSYISTQKKTEYYTREYSLQTFRLLRSGIVTDTAAGEIKWTWAAGCPVAL